MSRLRRCKHLLSPPEGQLALGGADNDSVAFLEVAFEQPQREWVLDQFLDRPLQRTGAVGGIPAGLDEHLLRGVGQFQRQAAFSEPVAQPPELDLDDLVQLLVLERLELDDLVDPVQELGPEDVA
jgi:hypothetical protein